MYIYYNCVSSMMNIVSIMSMNRKIFMDSKKCVDIMMYPYHSMMCIDSMICIESIIWLGNMIYIDSIKWVESLMCKVF